MGVKQKQLLLSCSTFPLPPILKVGAIFGDTDSWTDRPTRKWTFSIYIYIYLYIQLENDPCFSIVWQISKTFACYFYVLIAFLNLKKSKAQGRWKWERTIYFMQLIKITVQDFNDGHNFLTKI